MIFIVFADAEAYAEAALILAMAIIIGFCNLNSGRRPAVLIDTGDPAEHRRPLDLYYNLCYQPHLQIIKLPKEQPDAFIFLKLLFRYVYLYRAYTQFSPFSIYSLFIGSVCHSNICR